jgi:hypothetical protein
MKTVQRRNDSESRTTLLANRRRQRSRERRLPCSGRPGDAEQEPPARCVDCGE